MAGITTHVLDTSKGNPAQGVAITLEVLRANWELVGRGSTDAGVALARLPLAADAVHDVVNAIRIRSGDTDARREGAAVGGRRQVPAADAPEP